MKSGFIKIDKPEDWTSHDVVAYLRGVTKIKKIGHAGTLDPFATGLLIVGINREATKNLSRFKDMKKTYIAGIELGSTSNTYDKTGTITKKNENIPSKEQIEKTVKSFLGEQKQVPPMFSAKKIKGQKLYELARKGIEIERKPCDINIYNIDVISYTYPLLTIRLVCSPGTYIRTIANDLGEKLGTGAYCKTLKRTHIGEYSLDKAISPKNLEKNTYQKHLFLLDKKGSTC